MMPLVPPVLDFNFHQVIFDFLSKHTEIRELESPLAKYSHVLDRQQFLFSDEFWVDFTGQIYDFLLDLCEHRRFTFPNITDCARYVFKQSGTTSDRSKLFFATKEEPHKIFCIIKSRAHRSKITQKNILYAEGSFKSVKNYSFLYSMTFKTRSPQLFSILEQELTPIVTMSKPSAAYLRLLETDPKFKDLFYNDFYSHSEFKRIFLEHLMKDQKNELIQWDEFLAFHDPRKCISATNSYRLIGYCKKVGQYPLEIESLTSWNMFDRICGILSFLQSIKHALSRHFLPSDLKFENMRVDLSGRYKKIYIIDYINEGGSTYTLFKADVESSPKVRQFNNHPNPKMRVTLEQFSFILTRLQKRQPLTSSGCLIKNEEYFKLIVFQLLFEISFNCFFLFNLELYKKNKCFDWVGYTRPFVTEKISDYFTSIRRLGLSALFEKYTLGQNYSKPIREIILEFFEILITELSDLSPFDFDSIPEELQSVITPKWAKEFCDLIEKLPFTPSPFNRDLNIRRLTMI